MRGQDQSAPSDPIKTDAGPSLILTKPPLIVSPASRRLLHLLLGSAFPVTPPTPATPIPTTPAHPHPPPSLSDFAITPRDKQRPRLAHKAGVLCIMLTIKDSISSLILFTSPAVARPGEPFYKYCGAGLGNADADVHLLVKGVSNYCQVSLRAKQKDKTKEKHFQA